MSASKRTRDDPEVEPITQQRLVKNLWARNRSELVELNYKWVVENFSLKSQKKQDAICSPSFSASNNHSVWWELELYPGCKMRSTEDKAVGVYLTRTIASDPVAARFEITLLNKQEQVLKSRSFSLHYFEDDATQCGSLFFCRQDVIEAGKLKPSDELHIHCKIQYELQTTTIRGSFNKEIKPLSAGRNLTSSFEAMFNSRNMPFTDLEIAVGCNTIRAHKIVLASRSPVFEAMFQADGFTENRSNVIKIDDLSATTVYEMIRFVYTDQVEDMETMAKDLLVAADKYLIDLFKSKCEDFLVQTLTIVNCSEMFLFADKNSAERLKEAAKEFILFHAAEVVQTHG